MHPGPTTMGRVLRHYVAGGSHYWPIRSGALSARLWDFIAYAHEWTNLFFLPGDRAQPSRNYRIPATPQLREVITQLRAFFSRMSYGRKLTRVKKERFETIRFTIERFRLNSLVFYNHYLSTMTKHENEHESMIYFLRRSLYSRKWKHPGIAHESCDRRQTSAGFVVCKNCVTIRSFSLSRRQILSRAVNEWSIFSRPYLSLAFTRSAAFLRSFVAGKGEGNSLTFIAKIAESKLIYARAARNRALEGPSSERRDAPQKRASRQFH